MRRLAGMAIAVAAVAALALSGGPAAAAPALGRHIRGREVFRIVGLSPTATRQVITARGAFDDSGHLVIGSRYSTADFKHGRVKIARVIKSTTYRGPDLRTCEFSIRQTGTFRVVHATGRYARIRERGTYRMTITGTLRRDPAGGCESQIIVFRQVTYERGTIS